MRKYRIEIIERELDILKDEKYKLEEKLYNEYKKNLVLFRYLFVGERFEFIYNGVKHNEECLNVDCFGNEIKLVFQTDRKMYVKLQDCKQICK